MKLTKSGKPDKRYRSSKTFEARDYIFWKKYGYLLAVAIMGFMAGVILTKTLWDIKNAPPKPLGQTIEVKTVKVAEAIGRPFCADVIKCIRDVGEELGRDNQTIMTMIRIARAESTLRADAINKNRNGTYDMGVFQINDVHGKRISRADRMDFEKNIRFAYKLQGEQGFNPWNSSRAKWLQ